MPQPLSRIKPDARVTLSAAAFSHFPELATLAVTTIGIGSEIDNIAGHILSAMLRSDLAVGLAMYEALVSADAKRAALEGAARVAVSDSDFNLFRAVVKVTKATRDRRNEFAHHLWGWSPDLEGALLLVDPKIVTRSQVTMREWSETITAGLKAGKMRFEDIGEVPPAAPAEHVVVYRKNDLQTCAKAAFMALQKWQLLNLAFRMSPTVDQARPLLLSDPQIQQALQQLSSGSAR